MTRAIPRLLLAIAVLGAGPVLGGAMAGARQTQTPSPEIEILDAGSEPREALQLAPSPSASERSTTNVRLEIAVSPVSDRTIKQPPLRATMAATLQDVTPNGEFHATITYPAFEVLKGNGASAAQRQATERALAGITGLSGEFTVTARGALVDSKLDIPAQPDPRVSGLLLQLRDQFRDFAVPLPEPEIGVGARWRATTQLTINEIQVRQVFEYRVKKRTDTTLDLDVRGTRTAKRQTIDSTSGVQLRVKRYKTTVRGETTVDTTHLLPVTSRLRASADQTYDVRAGGKSGEVRQHIGTEVVIKPE